jgi:hypothetical protein
MATQFQQCPFLDCPDGSFAQAEGRGDLALRQTGVPPTQ